MYVYCTLLASKSESDMVFQVIHSSSKIFIMISRTARPMASWIAHPMVSRIARPMVIRIACPMVSRIARPMVSRITRPMVSRIARPMVSRIARSMEVGQLGQTVKTRLYTGKWPSDMAQQQPQRRKCDAERMRKISSN